MYTIYVLNDPAKNADYEFATSDDGDIISVKNKTDNSPYSKIYMRIVRSDGSFKLPDTSKDEEGFT